MSSLESLNPNSEVTRRDQALMMSLHAARGLQQILKTNLGPKGTIKMFAVFFFQKRNTLFFM